MGPFPHRLFVLLLSPLAPRHTSHPSLLPRSPSFTPLPIPPPIIAPFSYHRPFCPRSQSPPLQPARALSPPSGRPCCPHPLILILSSSLSPYIVIFICPYLSIYIALSLSCSLSHALSFLSIPIYLHPFCSPIAIYMPCYFLSSHPRSSRASPSSSRVAPSSSKVAPSSASEAPNSSMAAPSLVGAFSKITQHHGCDSVPPPPPTSLAHPSHLPHLSLSPPTPHALCPLSSIPHPSQLSHT